MESRGEASSRDSLSKQQTTLGEGELNTCIHTNTQAADSQTARCSGRLSKGTAKKLFT
jgi:hypothetical protein